jgi:hypothetical protein
MRVEPMKGSATLWMRGNAVALRLHSRRNYRKLSGR